jgi:hypothetical protein
MQKSKSESLAITSLIVEDGGFIIFYEPDTRTILGVIRGRTDSDAPIEAHET